MTTWWRSGGRGDTRGARGAAFDVAIAHVWTVRDGRVSRFEAYIDTPAMREALSSADRRGLSRPPAGSG